MKGGPLGKKKGTGSQEELGERERNGQCMSKIHNTCKNTMIKSSGLSVTLTCENTMMKSSVLSMTLMCKNTMTKSVQ